MLDLAIITLAYVGFRFYENGKKALKKPQKTTTKSKTTSQLSNAKRNVALKEDKERRHYQQMTLLTIGTAVMRMLSPTPTFIVLNIACYTYTMFPFYRQFEAMLKQRLLKKGEVDTYVLMGIGNLLLLGTGRYLTAAISLGLAYVGDIITTKAQETSQKQLTHNLYDKLFDPHQTVWLVQDGVELEVALGKVKQGDILLVKAGETIPIDGEVVAGMASVDQHAFTGESYPVEKGVGEQIFASTLMLTGKLHVRVEKSGHDTTIGKISDILNHSKHAKTELQLRGEQWAESANLPFLGLAGAGLALYGPVGAMVILSGNTVQAIRFLAPLATVNYQTVASHQQILVKQGQQLEQISSIDTFLFDKTGTLTDGELKVSRLHVVHADYQERDILFYAALAEHQLTHPIAKAIVQYAEQAGLNMESLEDIEYRMGYGIVVQFDNHTIHVGSARFMSAENIELSTAVLEQQAAIHSQGHSLVMVAIDKQVAGLIELEATLRPEVKTVFKCLRQQGIKHIAIVSGDHAVPTQKLAELLGADSFFAEVLPEDKANIVQQFKAKGHTVCFIGDGVNDAIAMQQADLSVSLRGATTLATDVADIILIDPNLTRLTDLLTLSQRLEANLKRGLNVCYLGMGIVIVGTVLARIDILIAMGVHFVLGSTAVGNAMLPLLEVNKKLALPKRENQRVKKIEDS